jgi:phenylalanyl-tRNA synthetase beta chain
VPLPGHPAVRRDLALVMPVDRPILGILDLLRQRGQRFAVESVEVVDEFRGSSLPPGMRSVAVRLVFRHAERTLTDTEVDQAIGRLVGMLERECDVTLRST